MKTRRLVATIGCMLTLTALGCSDDADGDTGGGMSMDTGSLMEPDTSSGGDDTMEGGGSGDTSETPDTNGGSGDATGGGSQQPTADDFEVVECGNVEASTEVNVGPGLLYEPEEASVPQGEVVKWTWPDGVNSAHNVVGGGDCNSPNSEWFESETTAESGTTFCVRFVGEPGTYEYQCSVPSHCISGMKATIDVTQ